MICKNCKHPIFVRYIVQKSDGFIVHRIWLHGVAGNDFLDGYTPLGKTTCGKDGCFCEIPHKLLEETKLVDI